jgi:hypothetical protein
MHEASGHHSLTVIDVMDTNKAVLDVDAGASS